MVDNVAYENIHHFSDFIIKVCPIIIYDLLSTIVHTLPHCWRISYWRFTTSFGFFLPLGFVLSKESLTCRKIVWRYTYGRTKAAGFCGVDTGLFSLFSL